MNVEHQTYGLPDWQFPSPSSTPRSTPLHQAPFETPKVDISAHFADAFRTPQTIGQQTPAQTPLITNFTITNRPSNVRRSPLTPDDPKFYIHHFTKYKHLPLPPVDPSRRLSSSPDPIHSSANLQRSLSVPRSRPQHLMESFQVHTPPPTRDSSSGREYAQGQGSQATAMVTPQGAASTPSRPPPTNFQTPQFHTPFHYPQLQFTPEMYHFQQDGPASAPAMPQRVPWDHSPQMTQFGGDMVNAAQNPFIPNQSMNAPMQDWQVQQTSPMDIQAPFSSQSSISAQSPQNQDFWQSGIISPEAASFSQGDSFVGSSTGVNPSMIFSFSSAPQTVDPSSLGQFRQANFETRQQAPFDHQPRDSTRDRDWARRPRQQQQQPPHNTSSAGSGRTGLQRSNTDSGFRVRNKSADSRSAPAGPGHEHIPRRPSPLKRLSQVSLSSIPETIRPLKARTRLIVDESGTARTERVTEDEFERRRSSRSSQYSGTDSDTDNDGLMMSKRNSFAPSEHGRPAKHKRTDSEDDRLDAPKRPLSSASLSSISSRLMATPLGRKSSADPLRRISIGSFGDDSGSLADEEEEGDAQAALKKLVGGRGSKRHDPDDPDATIRASSASSRRHVSSSIFDLGKFQSPHSSSPAIVNRVGVPPSLFPTPTTDRSGRTGSSNTSGSPSTSPTSRVRCVCGSNAVESSAHLMLQCSVCASWLHSQCVFGLQQNKAQAARNQFFMCPFCEGNAGPASRQAQQGWGALAGSPLGYKSSGGGMGRIGP